MPNKFNWKLETGNWKLILGFTIIELLIVMGILAVLSTFFISGYTGTQRRARDAERKSDLKQIANSLELYFNDHHRYTAASGITIAGCPSTGPTSCAWGSGPFTDGTTVYFKIVPSDPSNGFTYVYRTDANGTNFRLYARLENSDDPDIITGLSENACHASGCNFAITSGNVNP